MRLENEALAPVTPAVLFLVFNRPEETQRVFAAIRDARPQRLYVGADGPRPDRPGEAELCEDVRRIATTVDWPCDVDVLFRDENLGCADAVEGAIDWFFSIEEEGIILEDDCLPAAGFFDLCSDLLERYRDDKRIMLVSGYNYRGHYPVDGEDYFFSHFGGIWGWASWRRAWALNDREWPLVDLAVHRKALRSLLGPKGARARQRHLRLVRRGVVSSWAYKWGFARNLNSGLAAVPVKSLVENIGFGDSATHTSNQKAPDVAASAQSGPFKANPIVVADRAYDDGFHPETKTLRWAAGRVASKLGVAKSDAWYVTAARRLLR